MKIAVVGCGAVGSFYGALLGRAGQEVHFLLRSDYETVRRDGVLIRAAQGDFRHHPHCARQPEEIGVCDLVLIALKSTANDQLPRLVTPLVGPDTAILTLQNGLGNEAVLAGLFGPEKILGGLCFVCLNRVAPGVIQHIAHATIVMGEYQGPPLPRTAAVAQLFREAEIPCHVAENLAFAHWEKLVWNIPFNGLGVAGAAGYEAATTGSLPPEATLGSCLATDALLADARWEQLVRELMLEVVASANALGLAVPVSAVENQITRTREMADYKASTLLDFEKGLPLELETLFFEPLRQAQTAGVPTPRLSALCAVLKAIDSRVNPRTRNPAA